MSIHVSILQSDLFWEDINRNLSHFEERILDCQPTDLILLPEMFSTGFSMRPEQFATAGGEVLNWMKRLALVKGAAICGSVMTSDQGRYFNRLYFVKPNGEYGQYDKRHLFTMGDEPDHYSAGQDRLIVEYKGFRILPLVCYDLRFPVFSRNDVDYDLLLYVANWPERRRFHWSALLRARAIENQCFVAACNRVGVDGNGVTHSGDSALIDYQGGLLDDLEYREGVVSATLDKDALLRYREVFPALKDRDFFSGDWQ